MTNEERTVKLAELRQTAESAARDYNTALMEKRFDAAHRADEAIADAVGEYNAIARMKCFEHCKSCDDPMLEAVKLLTFEGIAVKEEKRGDDEVPVRTIVERDRPIDLARLDKYCGGIGADRMWIPKAEKLNCLLTAQRCVDLGISPKVVNDSFEMSAIAKQIDLGKTPTSKTNILRTLQTVVSAMIGDDYKVTSHDVNFLISVYAKKARKALTVVCADHRALRAYLAEICHRVVTNGQYEVVFKQKRKAVTTSEAAAAAAAKAAPAAAPDVEAVVPAPEVEVETEA